MLSCGKTEGVLSTVDFGANTNESIQASFDLLKKQLKGHKGSGYCKHFTVIQAHSSILNSTLAGS